LDPEATIGAAATLLLVVGFAAGAVPPTVGRRARASATVVVPSVAAVLAAVAFAHAVSGADAAFGVVPVRSEAGRLYLPLVNPNHLAAVMTALLPVCLDRALSARASLVSAGVRLEELPPVVGTAAILSVLVALRSASGLAVGALIVVWAVARSDWAYKRVAAPIVAVLGAIAAAATVVQHPSSVSGRLGHWWDGVRAVPAYLWVGSGVGSWAEAVSPYRTDTAPIGFAHAHAEWLERLVETGLLGVPAVGIAVWLLRPLGGSSDPRATPLTVGLAALLVAGLYEFPTRIPAILLVGAGLWAYRRAFDDAPRVSLRSVRVLMVGLALAQLPAAAWRAREAVADAAAAQVVASRGADTGAASRLAWTAPWRGEAAMAPVWAKLGSGDVPGALDAARGAVARHTDDARVLVAAGEVMAQLGDAEGALAAIERGVARAPFDPRPRVALARHFARDGRPERAVLAWEEAFARDCGVAYLSEAWALLPDAVVWSAHLRRARGVYAATLASKFVGADDPLGALVLWDTAALAAPDAYTAAQGRMRAMVAAGLTEDAESILRAALADRPDDPTLLDALGEVLLAQGRLEDAAAAWLAASARRPAIIVKAVRALAEAGHAPEALSVARRARLSGASDPALVVEMAQIMADGGDPVGCLQLLDTTRFSGAASLRARADALRAACRDAG
jgi:tetratricopeptide (TPR) repeat protein